MTECYQLKYVKIGDEIVGARPTGWDKSDVDGFGHDEEGNDVNAIEWNTTCPQCADLVTFDVASIYQDRLGTLYVSCDTCQSPLPDDVKQIQSSNKGLDSSDPVDVEALLAKFGHNDLIDPISEKLFDIEIDLERMPGLSEST